MKPQIPAFTAPIALVLLAACAPAAGTRLQSLRPSLSGVAFGNGSGYGGTQTLAGLTFYRLDGSYSCQPGTGGAPVRSHRSAIFFPPSFSPYAVLRGDACGSGETPLCQDLAGCPAELEHPPAYYPSGTRLLIGYGDAIYEERETPPQPGSPGEQYVETWCRSAGATVDRGVDVIVRASLGSDERSATLIVSGIPSVSDGGGRLVPSFAVAQAETGGVLSYSAPAFSVTVGPSGSGTLDAVIDGEALRAALRCRTERN